MNCSRRGSAAASKRRDQAPSCLSQLVPALPCLPSGAAGHRPLAPQQPGAARAAGRRRRLARPPLQVGACGAGKDAAAAPVPSGPSWRLSLHLRGPLASCSCARVALMATASRLIIHVCFWVVLLRRKSIVPFGPGRPLPLLGCLYGEAPFCPLLPCPPAPPLTLTAASAPWRCSQRIVSRLIDSFLNHFFSTGCIRQGLKVRCAALR